MPVLGIMIRSINAEKKSEVTKGVKVNNETKITGVSEKNLAGFGQRGLIVNFEFGSNYVDGNSKIAHIKMSGEVLFVDKEQGKMIEEWSKKKALPDAANLQIINAILRKCIIRSLGIGEELGLPPLVKLPFASKKKESDSRYIG